MATLLQSQQNIPDLVIAFCTISFLQLFDMFCHSLLSPRLRAYRHLSFRDRYEWDRRFTNMTFQVLQLFFNLYILFVDREAKADSIYGYSRIVHVGFIVILSFYVHDTTGMVFHPRAPSLTFVWIIHHFVAAGLLVYNVSFKQSSAFPAAAFLISAAGHIPNDLRWFLTVTGIFERSSIAFRDAFNVATVLAVSVFFFIPPAWLLVRCADQLDVSVYVLVSGRMMGYCNFFFALIYFAHVGTLLSLCSRTAREWRKQPQKFRHSKQQ